MRDSQGVRWLSIREATAETGMARSTIMGWVANGLPSQLVRGKRYVREPELFATFRASLGVPRIKTRWRNRNGD